MRVNSKVLLFLSGLILGLSLSFLFVPKYQYSKAVIVDLKKIIKNYSVNVVNSKQSSDTIAQDFKDKFEEALRSYPGNTLIIVKGQVLSKQGLEDDTENFIQSMGVTP
jgi:hypothetical protein